MGSKPQHDDNLMTAAAAHLAALENKLLEHDTALTESDHSFTASSEMQKRQEEKDVALAAAASTHAKKEHVGWLSRLWRRGKSHAPKESTSDLNLQPIVFT